MGGMGYVLVRLVEVVIVNVQLRIGISFAGSFESDANEVLAQDVREDRLAQGTVLVEDFVHDVLNTS